MSWMEAVSCLGQVEGPRTISEAPVEDQQGPCGKELEIVHFY